MEENKEETPPTIQHNDCQQVPTDTKSKLIAQEYMKKM